MEDMFFHLGAPDDFLSSDGRILAWVNVDTKGGGLVVYYGTLAVTVDRLRVLAVRFDDSAVVADRWLQTYTCIAAQLPTVNRELRECPHTIPNTGPGHNIEWSIH